MKRRYMLTTPSSGTPGLWTNYVTQGITIPPVVINRAAYQKEVLDQLLLGDCTVFGSYQWRLAMRVAGGGEPFDIDKLQQYAEERAINGTLSSDSGATTAETIQTWEEFGAKDATPSGVNDYGDDNYGEDYLNPPSSQWDTSLRVNPAQVNYIDVQGRKDALQATKEALARGLFMLAAYEVTQALESADVAISGILPLPSPSDNIIGGHMTVIVGYDDSKQAFLVLNQWNRRWGIKAPSYLRGCYWMPYAYFTKYVFDVVVGWPDNGVAPKPCSLPTDDYEFTVWFDPETTTQYASSQLCVTCAKGIEPIANANASREFAFYGSMSSFTTNEQVQTSSDGLYSVGLSPVDTDKLVATCSWVDPTGKMHTETASVAFTPMPKALPNDTSNGVGVEIQVSNPHATVGDVVTITGTFTQSGKPLVAYPITFEISDGDTQTLETDTNGQAQFEWGAKKPGFVTVTVGYGDLKATTVSYWSPPAPPVPTPAPTPPPNPAPPPTPVIPSDIDHTQWEKVAEWAIQNGIMYVYQSDGLFKPDQDISRGQFAASLMNLYKLLKG